MATVRQEAERSIERYARSIDLRTRAERVLAGGVSTAFRMYERPTPLFVERADGAELWDVDGHRYVDYVCGYGPVILGHGDTAVLEAVASAATTLQQTGAQHHAELTLAETLCECVPAFESVRFSLSGSEAIHAAIRVARAATGRPLIVKFAGHYHGWLDGVFANTASRGAALPESDGQPPSALADIIVIDWNDVTAVEELFARAGHRLAGVVMEPIACNQGVIYPRPGYLERVQELINQAGAVLIFDEVITGFRLGLGGAQQEVSVTPDLAVVAKAMGNGFPISAFGGRADLMELVASNRVVHAGTFNGGGVSIAAASATIERLATGDAYERMRSLGEQLMAGLRSLAARHGHQFVAQGPGPVFFTWFSANSEILTFADHLQADAALYQQFAAHMLDEGVRLIPAGRWYLTASHTADHVAETLAAADNVFARLHA